MTTKLSPEVLEQLKLEAEKPASEYAFENGVCHTRRDEPAWHYSIIDFKAGYLAGAIAEREKAMELVEALKNIQAQSKFYSVPEELPAFKVCADLAKDALEKYLGKAKE